MSPAWRPQLARCWSPHLLARRRPRCCLLQAVLSRLRRIEVLRQDYRPFGQVRRIGDHGYIDRAIVLIGRAVGRIHGGANHGGNAKSKDATDYIYEYSARYSRVIEICRLLVSLLHTHDPNIILGLFDQGFAGGLLDGCNSYSLLTIEPAIRSWRVGVDSNLLSRALDDRSTCRNGQSHRAKCADGLAMMKKHCPPTVGSDRDRP